MTKAINRQFRLAARPVGDIKESDFEYREEPIPSPKEGEVLVRAIYLSLDPTNRIWMSDAPQYMPPVKIGEVMRGGIIGIVEESKNPKLKQGDLVSGMLGWQDYGIAEGNSGFSLTRLPNPLPCPLTAFTGPLGAAASESCSDWAVEFLTVSKYSLALEKAASTILLLAYEQMPSDRRRNQLASYQQRF